MLVVVAATTEKDATTAGAGAAMVGHEAVTSVDAPARAREVVQTRGYAAWTDGNVPMTNGEVGAMTSDCATTSSARTTSGIALDATGARNTIVPTCV